MVNLARIQEIEQILSTRYQRDSARYFPLSVLVGQGTIWILSLSKQYKLTSKPYDDQNLDCVPASDWQSLGRRLGPVGT